ncbi:MAG: glutathione S-transferase family protein [Pseudomonadota bacterium]
MKFYDFAHAPSPRRARMLIAEKGLNIETVVVDLGRKAQFEPAFRAINPACTIPVLELDDGTALTENNAIAVYLEEVYPEPPMLGVSAKEKALVTNWNDRCTLEGYSAVAESFRNFSKFFADRSVTGPQPFAQIPELVERGRLRSEAFLATMDERLSETPYLAGENFTYADITGFCLVEFAARIKLEPGEDQPSLKRWYSEIAERPSAAV